MKKALLLLIVSSVILSGCSWLPFGRSTNEPMATVIPAAPTLSDDQIAQLPPEVAPVADLLLRVGNSAIWVPESEEWGLKIPMTNGSGEVQSRVGLVTVALTLPHTTHFTEPPSGTTETGTTDVFVVANFNTNGSGNRQYVALFRETILNTNGKQIGANLIQTSDILIGDGVKISTVVARPHETNPEAYYVDVVYLDRSPGESTTTVPTIEKTKTLYIEQHVIQNEDGNMYLLQ